MTIWETLLLFLSVFIGGGIGFYLKKNDKGLLQLVLSFSGAYLLGITLLHLIPETYEIGGHQTGLFILIGFFAQLLLEQLSKGVEHGHIHALHESKTSTAITIMLGLSLHALFEGIPLNDYMHLHEHHHHTNQTHGVNHLLYGIILHKIPAAFALVVLLLLSKFKNSTVLFCLTIFALMSPLGVGISLLLGELDLLNKQTIAAIMGVVIGSFFHIATTILFETDTNHRIPVKKLLAIAVGILIALLTMHSS